jgi:anti-sigma B factor antagonist
VAIDFSEVSFLDSSGVSVIARVFKESQWLGGRLVLVGLSDRIRLVLEMTGVDKLVDIRDGLTAEEFTVEWILEGLPSTGIAPSVADN